MSGLGIPILGDDFYPVLTETPLGDFTRPLQLLAKVLEFTDPISGEPRRFESRAALQAWMSFEDWAA
jgi:tRNA pseudouridine32 synthase/23S rRNA pseudouridine746 synthase